MILQKTSLRRPNNSMVGIDDDEMPGGHSRHKTLTILQEFANAANTSLTSDQNKICNKLLHVKNGLHIVTGTPGSGKTHLIRFLAYQYVKANKSVILTATTGAAATRLSSIATTVHYQFRIPTRSNLYPLSIHETDDRYMDIKQADIIIIDELSMLTKTTFDLIVRQIVNITNGTLLDPFIDKAVILIGDLAQLPPVCNHTSEICYNCHITNSIHWLRGKGYQLSYSVRHAKDVGLMEFLTTIRHRQPTTNEIFDSLGMCILDISTAQDYIDTTTTIVCTHREDVQYYNNFAIRKFHMEEDITHIKMKTNALEIPILQHWLDDKRFNEIELIAIGARCMITENIDLTIGAANGAICTVEETTNASEAEVSSIVVRIHSTGKTMTLRRTKHK